MERVGVMICWLVFVVAPVGCSKSTETELNATADGSQSGSKQAPGASGDEAEGPAEAVFAFLEAVRTGDDAKANEMLTELAREKTAEQDMVVAPAGSETASFEVADVEINPSEESENNEELAHVSSTWTDIDDLGEPHSDEIIWALRHEPEGWRIAGMTTRVFDDLPPVVLDFEDPEDMQAKQDAIEREMARRARQQAEAFVKEQRTDTTELNSGDDEAEGDLAEDLPRKPSLSHSSGKSPPDLAEEQPDDEPEEQPVREVRQTKPKAKTKLKRR